MDTNKDKLSRYFNCIIKKHWKSLWLIQVIGMGCFATMFIGLHYNYDAVFIVGLISFVVFFIFAFTKVFLIINDTKINNDLPSGNDWFQLFRNDSFGQYWKFTTIAMIACFLFFVFLPMIWR